MDNLIQVQARMKFFADRNRTEPVLEVGDYVYLKLQPYRQSSVAVRQNLKLSAKYYGPFQIFARVGSVAYRLDLPAGSTIHPVFHVSELKKHVGPAIKVQQSTPVCDSEGHILIQLIAILQWKMVKVNNAVGVKVLVHWANLAPDEATWEDWGYIKGQFPEFVAQLLP